MQTRSIMALARVKLGDSLGAKKTITAPPTTSKTIATTQPPLRTRRTVEASATMSTEPRRDRGFIAAATTFVKESPGTAACTVVAAGGLAVVAAPTIVTGPLLAFAGFTPLGPAAGSLAVMIQSGLGNVLAGSAFATLQSAAMGGYGAAVVAGAAQGAGAVVAAAGAAGAAGAALRGRPDEESDGEEADEEPG